MTNASIHTQGTLFKRGTGAAPYTYTTVAGVLDVSQPGWKRKALDVTTLDQADNYKQVVGSVLIENEPVELELLFDPDGAQQILLEGDKATAAPVPYSITLRNGDVYAFLGVITAWKPSGKMDDNIKIKATIEVSGAVTYTAGT